MNVPLAETWYQTVASMDIFLIGLWLLAALIVAGGLVVSRITKPKTIPGIQITIPVWMIVLVGLIVRLPRMTSALWYDETYTALLAQLPMDRFWTALSGDVHPPLYYLLAKLSGSMFGFSNEWALRLPSLVAGLLLIVVVYKLSSEAFRDESISRLAALVVALLPSFVHYSAEARYPIVLCLAVTVAWLSILRKERGLFVIATSCAALLHATGVVYAATLIAYACWRHRRSFLIPVLSSSLMTVATVTMIVTQAGDVSNGFWLWRMIPLWHIVDGTVLRPFDAQMLISYVFVIVLTLIAGWRLMHDGTATRHYMLIVGVSIPLLVFLIGIIWKPVYLPRALLSSVIPLVIGMALIARRNAIYSAMLVIVVIPSLVLYLAHESKTESMRELFAECAGADYVYTTSTNMAVISAYYADGHSLTFLQGNNQHQEISLAARTAMGFDFTPPELLSGSFCSIHQWSYYTTDDERQQIEALRRYGEAEIIEGDAFSVYEIFRWTR